MTDLARQIIASQSHRRFMDPMSFRRWDKPFSIERVSADPASMAIGQDTRAVAGTDQGNKL